MLFRFGAAFRVAAWLLTLGGVWYLYLALRSYLERGRVWWSLILLGVAAIAIGTSLLRWFRRQTPD